MVTAADIRVARARIGEFQFEFARRFGVHQATISKWESDGPPSDGPIALLIERVLKEISPSEAS